MRGFPPLCRSSHVRNVLGVLGVDRVVPRVLVSW